MSQSFVGSRAERRPAAVPALLLGTLACLAASLPAAAAPFEFEITPSVGFRFFGEFEDVTTADSVDLDESAVFSLAFDIEYSPDEAWQLFYSRQSTEVSDVNPALDLDVEYLQIGGVAEFPLKGEMFIPYAVGTIGAARFSPGGSLDDETRFAFTLGGGWKYYFNDHFGLRFEGRGYVTVFDSDASVFCVSDQGSGSCLLRTSGSLVWQLEAQAGFTYRF
jgi:hypothetical protein